MANNKKKKKKSTAARTTPHTSKNIPCGDMLTFAERIDKFHNEKGLDRLQTLTSMVHILNTQVSRITAEIECLMENYGLVTGDILKQITSLNKAQEKFFDYIHEAFVSSEENNISFNIDSDRLDRDIYRYLGVKQTWRTGESSHISNYVGPQNFVGIGESCNTQGGNYYIGRSHKGELWICDNEQLEPKVGLKADWFPNIKNGEYFLMELTPRIYVDAHR